MNSIAFAVVATACAVVGCARRAPISSCTDDLRGVYLVDGRRWMMVDNRTTLEVYPLFDDAPDAPLGREIAPRVIDLERAPDRLAGNVRRRYMKGAVRCEAKVPVHVTACANDTLEVVLADPVAPIEFEPCTWPRPGSSRVERWHHE